MIHDLFSFGSVFSFDKPTKNLRDTKEHRDKLRGSVAKNIQTETLPFIPGLNDKAGNTLTLSLLANETIVSIIIYLPLLFLRKGTTFTFRYDQ